MDLRAWNRRKPHTETENTPKLQKMPGNSLQPMMPTGNMLRRDNSGTHASSGGAKGLPTGDDADKGWGREIFAQRPQSLTACFNPQFWATQNFGPYQLPTINLRHDF